MITLEWSSHRAVLEPFAGVGVLVLPNLTDEPEWLYFGGEVPASSVSVHAAELVAVARDLEERGWRFTPPDDPGLDIWSPAGQTADGRLAVGLYTLDSITSDPTLVELDAALRDALEVAGAAAL